MHNPWRQLRALVDWTLEWSRLPDGTLGLNDYESKTITLTTGTNQAERRCTIAHELEHVARGPVTAEIYWPREESVIDRTVARQLLPDVRAIGEALAWAYDLAEAADELWVDEPTLRVRLESAHPAEKAYLRRRLAHENSV